MVARFSADGGKVYVVVRQDNGASSLLEISVKSKKLPY